MNGKTSSLVFFLLCNAAAFSFAQLCTPDSFRVLRGLDQPSLIDITKERTVEFLQHAACTGEKVMIELLADTQTAFVQHGVNVVIDCAPLLGDAGKPVSGAFKWSRSELVQNGDGELSLKSTAKAIEHRPTASDRRRVEGDFNRFLNITSSSIIQGRSDPDNGIYTCEACTSNGCFSASLVLYLVGAPPQLDSAEDNAPAVFVDSERSFQIYRVGPDFCVERGSQSTFRLTCGVRKGDDHTSPAFPAPSRKWYKDDVLIYSVPQIGGNIYNVLNSDFYNHGNNSLLRMGALLPMPCALDHGGSIQITFAASRPFVIVRPDVLPEGTTEENVQEKLFEALLGSWRCEVENNLGFQSAESVISEC